MPAPADTPPAPSRAVSAPDDAAPAQALPRSPQEERADLIREIEKGRGLRLLSLVISDRSIAVGQVVQSPFQLTQDIPRQVLDHLETIGHVPKLGVFLYSRGGDTSVPWVLVSLLREYCDELEIVIPYKAHSAATMIALGADQIVMGRHAQLGPIDPTMTFQEANQQDPSKSKTVTIAVEDITSYIKLAKEGVGITDQRELGEAFGRLSAVVSPVTLGTINRQQAYIRMVARKLLKSRRNPPQVAETEQVVEGLISQTYFHQHVINRAEAVRDIGIDNVATIDDPLDDKIWSLFLNYERAMSMRSVVNGANLFAPADPDQTDRGECHRRCHRDSDSANSTLGAICCYEKPDRSADPKRQHEHRPPRPTRPARRQHTSAIAGGSPSVASRYPSHGPRRDTEASSRFRIRLSVDWGLGSLGSSDALSAEIELG